MLEVCETEPPTCAALQIDRVLCMLDPNEESWNQADALFSAERAANVELPPGTADQQQSHREGNTNTFGLSGSNVAVDMNGLPTSTRRSAQLHRRLT